MKQTMLALTLLVAAFPALLAAQSSEKKHILVLGGSTVYAHDAVSHAMYTMAKIGQESGLFDTRFRTETSLLTKKKLGGNLKNLDYFDAVMFYTQGDLPLTADQKADLMSFVREDGKGILVAHSGTDSFRDTWPEYVEMTGGTFNHHPWHQKVRVNVEDRGFPITKHFPPSFEITDEIYQLKDYSREKVRVLMSLDVNSVDLNAKNVERRDNDFAFAWVKNWGKGRVFSCVLGHREEVWDDPDIQKMWLEAARWVFGLTDGDTSPRPKPTED